MEAGEGGVKLLALARPGSTSEYTDHHSAYRVRFSKLVYANCVKNTYWAPAARPEEELFLFFVCRFGRNILEME